MVVPKKGESDHENEALVRPGAAPGTPGGQVFEGLWPLALHPFFCFYFHTLISKKLFTTTRSRCRIHSCRFQATSLNKKVKWSLYKKVCCMTSIYFMIKFL